MRDYVLRRLLLVPLTFVGITFVAFCFTRFVPGGPIEQAMAERQQAENRKRTSAARPSGPASPEELDNLRRRYGFDRPLLQAYAIWLGALPGPADWVTVRLDKDGKAEADVADEEAEDSPLKLIVRAENGGFAVTPADAKLIRPDWRAEAAPLPDDPEKAPRVLVYRRAYAGLLQGELGDSTSSDRPVWDEIKERLPISAWFGAWSLLLAYGISIPLGVAKALKRDGWFDRGSSQVLFILDIGRRWFQNDLKLIVMLQTVGVFTITTICRPATWLNISRVPTLRPDGTQKSCRVEGASPHLHIKRLHKHTALISPELL